MTSIDPGIRVAVLDCFPTFGTRKMRRPQIAEMLAVRKALEGRGLKSVIVRMRNGHAGPGDRDVRLPKR